MWELFFYTGKIFIQNPHVETAIYRVLKDQLSTPITFSVLPHISLNTLGLSATCTKSWVLRRDKSPSLQVFWSYLNRIALYYR
jgi:hypothetical protein